MRLDVLATPGEPIGEELSDTAVVVVDAIRATTSLLAGLEAGAARALTVGSIEEALQLRSSIGPDTVVLCGERGGRAIEGFDLGNSPLEFRPEAVSDRVLVCTTTNGTMTFEKCRRAGELLLGCFRNRRAVAERVTSLAGCGNGRVGYDRVSIVCAGKEGRLSLDDVLCAGLIAQAVQQAAPTVEISDGTRAALALAQQLGSPSAELLGSTAAGEALVEIGLEADLDYCAQLDVSRGIPRLGRDGFVLSGNHDA